MDVTSTGFADLRASARTSARRAGAADAWVDDIADEALLRLFLEQPQPDKPRAWVRRVARNLAIDAYRGEPAAGWREMPLTDPGLGQDHYPPHLRNPSPSAPVRRRLQVDLLLAVVTPIEQRLLIGAAAGLSTKELAEKYGYTEGSVRTKISNAYKKLRAAFPDRNDFDF